MRAVLTRLTEMLVHVGVNTAISQVSKKHVDACSAGLKCDGGGGGLIPEPCILNRDESKLAQL